MTICDPACGTGGFILAAHNYLADTSRFKLDKKQKQALQKGTFYGTDIVDSVVRLCVMNLMLHGIGGDESARRCAGSYWPSATCIRCCGCRRGYSTRRA